MFQELICGVVGLTLLAYVGEYLFSRGDDRNEPPRLRSRVPLFGHVLGFLRSGPSYHTELRDAIDAEVYTLGIFNLKLYTSVSTRLLPAIQRQSKTLSFRPMVQMAARRWGDASEQTNEIFASPHFINEDSQILRQSLAPGPHLDEMNQRMGSSVLVELSHLLKGSSKQIKLLEWARYAVTQASSCGVYGTRHPFLDLEVLKAFWKWHAYLSGQISGLNLDVFKRGFAARQKVFDAHARYYENIPQDASPIIKDSRRARREAGMPDTDIIKQMATLPIGMLSNTVPTFYWTLWELFSRPDILAEVRDELKSYAIVKQDDGFVLDVAALKVKCPLLLSVFQETQRTHHIQAAIRRVMADTMLDGKYLLKEGNYIQMPGYLIHSNTSIWGPSAAEFDPYRFVNPDTKRGGSSFLAWGAPPHLCPARQFASTEILVLVALLAIRADLQPASGKWETNPALDFNDPITVLNPKKDVLFEIKVREEWNGKWALLTSESKLRVPLASG